MVNNNKDNNHDNQLEIELIKKDISMLIKLSEKMDLTLDKFQQITADLTKLVYLSERRLEEQEKAFDALDNKIEKNNNIRIEAYNEIKGTLAEHKELLEKNQDFTEQNKYSLNILNEKFQDYKTSCEKLREEVSTINIWRYMIMGGIALGVFLLTKAVDVLKLFR